MSHAASTAAPPRAAPRRLLPFLPLVPITVGILGITVAIAILLVGVRQLRQQSDRAAELRSVVIGEALAERLASTAELGRESLIDQAARRSGAELMLVRQSGQIVVNGSLGLPSDAGIVQLLVVGNGETTTQLGRTRFSATPLRAPLEHLSLLTFVRAPEQPFGTGSLFRLVSAFTLLLVAVGSLVAFAFSRDLHSDVAYVSARIATMARSHSDPAGEPIVVRSVDQVGTLTSTFNDLVDRFTAAEAAYHQDMVEAVAHDRGRSEFLAALSHELRTPLNAILGFTEVLLSEVDGPLTDEAKQDLEVVRESGAHLRRLIDDILDLSALESGELGLDREEFNLLGVADDVVRRSRVTASKKRLRLTLDGDVTRIYADRLRVEQIIDNLVSNAIKFTQEGGISITVGERDAHGFVAVADTGPGIAGAEQDTIFEEYMQAGNAQAQRLGSGLGLAITRRLVEMHGGRILLESHIGEGSCFTVFLPREDHDAQSSTPGSFPPELVT